MPIRAALQDLPGDDAAAEGLPTRLEGRQMIREVLTQPGRRQRLEISDLHVDQVHQTADPEVVILELTTVGRVTATGELFEVPCVQVFRIREGQIVLFRDYVSTQHMPDLRD